MKELKLKIIINNLKEQIVADKRNNDDLKNNNKYDRFGVIIYT